MTSMLRRPIPTPLRHDVIKWSGRGVCNDITLKSECHIYNFKKQYTYMTFCFQQNEHVLKYFYILTFYKRLRNMTVNYDIDVTIDMVNL